MLHNSKHVSEELARRVNFKYLEQFEEKNFLLTHKCVRTTGRKVDFITFLMIPKNKQSLFGEISIKHTQKTPCENSSAGGSCKMYIILIPCGS